MCSTFRTVERRPLRIAYKSIDANQCLHPYGTCVIETEKRSIEMAQWEQGTCFPTIEKSMWLECGEGPDARGPFAG